MLSDGGRLLWKEMQGLGDLVCSSAGGVRGFSVQERDEGWPFGKGFQEDLNVRHSLSNRRVRSWQSLGLEDTRVHGAASRRLLRGGEAQCQWAGGLRVLLGDTWSSRLT